MERRTLGNTGIEMSVLGFGCASVWSKSFFEEEKAAQLVKQALELGINFFDTSYSYGLAEERLGRVLKNNNVRREDVIISTKCGTRHENGKYYHDWSVAWLEESLNTSLSRLGVSYVDLLHLHGPEISDITPELLAFLDGLKRDGKVRAVGINTFNTETLEYVCEHALFDFVMLDYNILKRSREDLIARLNERGVGVIAGAPLAESLYSNRVFKIKSKKDLWYFLRACKTFRGQLIEGFKYRFVNKVDGISGNQVALKYVVNNPGVTAAVFGTTSPDHLQENVESLDKEIPEKIVERIRSVKMKHQDVRG